MRELVAQYLSKGISRRGFVGGVLGTLALAAAPVRAVARVRNGASAAPSEKVATAAS